MMWLVGVALANCPAPEAAIDALREAPSKENYDCVATQQDSGALLIEALAEGEDARLARALAIWRMLRLNGEIPPDEARSYPPAERRLLADALHAKHGRETPSADHAVVFENFAWYQPDPTYTDARLTDLDRANLEMVNDPPPPVVDEVIDDEIIVPEEPVDEDCGCTTAPSPAWAGLLGLLALARRR